MNCAEKGCVYPAQTGGLCTSHERMFDTSAAVDTLQSLEAVIESGILHFRRVAEALEKIYRMELYRQAGFETFRDYCAVRWKLKTSSAYNYLRALEVANGAPEGLRDSIGLNQAVELARMSEPDRQTTLARPDLQNLSVRGIRTLRKSRGGVKACPKCGFDLTKGSVA